MDVLPRDVPEQVVVTEQRMVDQAALESWLPGAMSRVHKAAGDAAAGTVVAWRVEAAHREAFVRVTKINFEVPAILSVYDLGARAAMAWLTGSRPGRAVMTRTMASSRPLLSRANAAGASAAGP